MFRFLFILLVLCAGVNGHQPNPYRLEDKYLINVPVLHVHEECSEKSSYCTESIYGHPVAIVERLNNGWVKIETEDNYQGYAKLANLIIDQPIWRTSKNLCRISSVCGLIYPIADTEKPALLRLPYGAYVELVEDYDSNADRWLEVKLIDGSLAWVQRGDVEKPTLLTLDEMLSLSTKFLQRPYIWGGKSSEGFDCTGFVQTLVAQMGVLLPRDSRPQAASEKLYAVELDELEPGDLLFFGVSRITHAGLYTGNHTFIHSGVGENRPRIDYSTLEAYAEKFQAARRVKQPVFEAEIREIDQEIEQKMLYSWKPNNPVPLSDLRYITLKHWGFDYCVHDGELVVHKDVAREVVEIFEELYDHRYPIEKMLLIDAYLADDDLSCQDNNTSCFCSRPITNGKEWSDHSYGLAIDINPLLNPYKNGNQPEPHKDHFLDRALQCRGLINEDDACYQAFTRRGWKWGGNWQESRGYIDYQHFYKN